MDVKFPAREEFSGDDRWSGSIRMSPSTDFVWVLELEMEMVTRRELNERLRTPAAPLAACSVSCLIDAVEWFPTPHAARAMSGGGWIGPRLGVYHGQHTRDLASDATVTHPPSMHLGRELSSAAALGGSSERRPWMTILQWVKAGARGRGKSGRRPRNERSRGILSRGEGHVQWCGDGGSVRVKVNDEMGHYFQTKKVLIQDDPMLPIL